MHYQEEKITVGKPASLAELLINFLMGFLLGYKILGAFFSNPDGDIQQFIFSFRGIGSRVFYWDWCLQA